MDVDLLNSSIQEFITVSVDKDFIKLSLKKNPFQDVEWITILNQIEAKKKSKDKLPLWFAAENIIYPTKIQIEQTSSEKTANYKCELVSGDSLIDLTGGFGVDALYFTKKIKKVIHCELNTSLSEVVRHNFKQLAIHNIQCYTGDSIEILKQLNCKHDWIYIDPSRRNSSKGKVFILRDCLPNVPACLDVYFEYTDKILIKTAPLLDLSAGLAELRNVKTIHIVAIENEVKELLWELCQTFDQDIVIKTINILGQKRQTFEFNWGVKYKLPEYGLPDSYLYEPNSAIMKSGGFDEVAIQYNLKKLHKHSHLYTNSTIIDFPGRIFEVENSFHYNKKNVEQFLKEKQFNVSVRNFPESVEKIRTKWKIKDGGQYYCFFTTDRNNNKIVLICKKIQTK